jgi:hypothetical protein
MHVEWGLWPPKESLSITKCDISSSHGGEYGVQNDLLGCTAIIMMMEAARTSET